MVALLARIATHPLVARVLIPSLAGALAEWFEKQANRIALNTAFKSARQAKTAEELRAASKKLSDASTRRT